jgi:hypothetical protein
MGCFLVGCVSALTIRISDILHATDIIVDRLGKITDNAAEASLTYDPKSATSIFLPKINSIDMAMPAEYPRPMRNNRFFSQPATC